MRGVIIAALLAGSMLLAACTREVTVTVVVTATPAGTPTLAAEELAYVEAIATAQKEATVEARVHARETVEAKPTRTPRPTPRPHYDLKLVSFRWYQEYRYVTVEGFVENVSGKALESVEAVAIFTDASGTPFTSESALIDYDPLLSGQTSPFKIMARYNPAMDKCRVEFKEFSGGKFKTDYSALP